MPTDSISSRAAAWWLGAVCLLGLGLRLYGLGWGLPDVHHPDEIAILNVALSFAKGSLNPHLFLYPTLYYYALFGWESLFFVAGRLTGLYGSVAAFEHEFFVDPSHLVLAGRALTAVFGTLTIAAVYQFGARLYDRATGLGAALLLAVAPFAVRDAHYIKHDVPVTLFIVLTQAAVARIVIDSAAAARRRSWIVAGAFAGLALSTHYYAFPVVLPIVAAAVMNAQRTRRWQPAFLMLVWAGVASIAAFLAASPFFLVEIKTVVRDMTAVKQIDIDRATHVGAFAYFGTYLQMIATDAIGWTTALGAAIGAIVAVVSDRRRAVVLLCFPLAFLVFLANTTPMNRYLNAMLPSLALAAAYGIRSRASFYDFRKKTPGFISGLLLIAIAVPGFIGSWRSDEFYRQADTRTLAREFIERTVPSDTTILVQPYSAQVRTSRAALVEALRARLGSETRASIKFQKQLEAAGDVSPSYRVLYLGVVTDGDPAVDKMYVAPAVIDGTAGLQPLRDRQVRYVVLKRYNIDDPALAPLLAALDRDGRRVARFSPYRADAGPELRAAVAPFFHNTAARIDPALERPGPIIDVWRID